MSRFYYLASPVPLPCGERGLIFTMKLYREVIAEPEYQYKQEESRQAGRIPLGDIVDLSYGKKGCSPRKSNISGYFALCKSSVSILAEKRRNN